MHTFIVTLSGFILLGFFIGIATRSKTNTARTTAALSFIPVWLVISVVHLCVGVFGAGYSLISELSVHAVVFGVPALTAWVLWRRFRTKS